MAQPVLGILTLYLNDKKQLEERHIYQRMIKEGQTLGLDVFVFTPMDVDDNRGLIHALIYDPKHKKWSRKWRKFPHLIFDRCRIQRSKRFEQLLRFRSRYGNLTYLNRPLRNKWTIYQTLNRKTAFRKHQPATVLFQNSGDVFHLLKNYPSVYVKPINGTGGRGILRVERLGGDMFLIQGRKQSRQIIPAQKLHKSRLGAFLLSWKGSGRFLAQQGIQIKLPSGRVADYRMLVQKNGHGQWEVTGCAGRIGPVRSVTSNLHGGGKAVTMNALLAQVTSSEEKRSEIRRSAEKLSLEIAAHLESTFGALCELALDLAIEKNGRVYVLEVNPKPAREVFIKSGDTESYRRAIIKPLEYAMWMYKRDAKRENKREEKHEDKRDDKREAAPSS
ncbi:glutathione synthase/RimK-type ligase-like ATP-grasp enzyme [Fontibacillus phaseoli]|uniref:Glutathione synthase/RimK-type ligase-like ATP-grasp enzyme n=1 Tax=Fontibacillus phaseoli TaxID=1416533 RepID=A0A369B7M6_9BACL|nr:YheC/YheD family protein [Fontibacillus phaseoli]RCX17315.1 glutathione synthase/RimK-type ligase-like ATP-grasp enzyme [Fontibacillus phaseoli]